MVVDQRTLRANMLRNNIGANVFNKLTGQQAQTPAQQPTNTPITQTRGLQQTQQPETYKVITNKFPTYDIKDMMGAGSMKNQIGFMQSVGNYNRLKAQADANTDPNVRYNLTKPQLTNKQTLQIEQATPETNEQGLKINKTNSFKDLVIDLKNGADQGGSLSFMKFRDLYPEYVENWDEVLDLYESIKANPAYTTEQITQNAQKQYPELFGINDNLSDKDKTTALKKLYDEMVSNKQNGIQLTQQDIIDRYPEYANTEDINTVMEVQNLMNRDRKNTPTFNDIYENFESLTKGDVEVGNTEKKQISDDLKSLDNIDANIYNYLSEEGQDYVKTLALAKEIGDMVRKDYRVPDNISDYDLLMKVKDEMPEVYGELTKGLNITNEISDYDRKIFEGKTTGKKFAQQSIKKIGGNLMAVLGPDAVKGLGILSNRLGDLVESGYTGISNKLENATGNRGIFTDNEGLHEGSHALGDTLIRASGWLKEDLESQDRYQEFLQEQGAEKTKGAGINFKGYKNALKEGDMKGVRDTFVKDVNEAKDLGWGTWLSKNLGSLGYLLPSMFAGTKAEMFLSFLPSGVGRAYEDYANDEGIKANLTDKQIQDRAILAGGLESLIEVMETPFRKGKRGSFMENFPGMRNAIVRTIMMTEKGAVGEGLEEVAQEFSNRLIAKASGSERDLGTLDEYLDIFAETVSSSQIVSLLGGSAEGIDQQKLNNLEQQIAEDTEYRNKILEGQAFVANDFNEFANAVEVVPGTTTEELQQVWNNAQQKKQDLENKANGITSNSYNNVNVPTYERTTVKENEQPKLSAKDSQEYTDLLDEMEKNGEITKEDRKKVETELGIFTRNVEQPKTEGLANIQKTNETKSETSTEEKRNIIDRIVDKGASIVTKTVSAQDKLYKAQEPRMNVLSNKKNLEKRRANSDRANELIVENGYKPTNTEERLNAHQATLNKLWDQVKEQVKQGEGITVDQTPIINALSEYIAEKKKLGIAGIESEIKALERELNAMKKSQEQGKTDLPVLEQKKQVFNDMIDWKEQEASEVYKGGLRLLTHEIGKVEDDLISKIPGEFTKLKQDVGALLDTYEDVFKAHMKNQRSKGIGLTETYSRIEGIGDMLQGLIGVFKGEGGKVISGAGKVLLGKSLARAKDVDFLIKKGFEELSNEIGSNTKNDNDTTTDKNNTPPTKPNKPKNNGPKPQTQPETEKKSEKKTDKAEQVQGLAKTNQNSNSETKGLGEISNKEKKTGKNKENMYNDGGMKETDQSAVSPSNDGESVQVVSFFAKSKKINTDKKHLKIQREITRNGKAITSNVRKGDEFSNIKDLGIRKGDEGYLENLKKVINGDAEGIIGKINIDGIDFEIKLDEKSFLHLFDKHGDFNLNNLITSTNHPDYKIIDAEIYDNDLGDYVPVKDKINLFKSLDDNHFLVVGANLENGYYIATHFEVVDKKGNKLKEYISRGTPLDEKTRDFVSEKSKENETRSEGLAAISVKVENGKVVKESEVEQESETVETPQEFEVLPADVRVADEEKQIGSKRIAPDRVPRQQTTYQGGIDKVYEKVKTIAEYMRVTDKYYSKDGHRDQNIAERFKKLRTDVQNILYGNEGFRFASDKSKEFKELWKNISDNKMLVAPLKEIAKNFYISRVKKDISKGYVYPQEVLEQIPGAEKAVNARQRYEKGLDTSFSAKDNRIDYSEKDVIGAGIKSQDGKQVTNEQKQDIVKGILDFGKTMGLDMKKFAEDRGLVYVHLHGGSPFLSTFGGMYREATSEQGDKNISVSVGGAENIRYKDKKTKERKTETLNTTMSHELGHAMDYLVDKRLLSWEQKSILRTKFNPVNRLYDYYSRPTEITARAIEQYVAIENGQADYYEENGNLDAGEFKGTDMEYYLKEIGSYYERPGYWNKSDYENYVKPYVEEAFKNNFNEYKTDTIGGKDINQIKQEAVQRGLAEISNL